MNTPYDSVNLIYDRPIERWDEALPLGNGHIGCLVWGDGRPLKLSLDRADLWDHRPAQETQSQEFCYKKLIELVREKKPDEIKKRFDECYNYPTPTKIPAGRIEIWLKEKPVKVESTLMLDIGMAEVISGCRDSDIRLKAYLHAELKLGWIRVEDSGDIEDIRIVAPGFRAEEEEGKCTEFPGIEASGGSLKELAYPARKWYRENELQWFVQKTAGELEYGIFMAEKSYGWGRDIVFYIGCNSDGIDWISKAGGLLTEALDQGYERVLESHTVWWGRFWEKSALSLPDKLFEKQWYLTNYLFGSCSRKGCPPMPLQGVWTAAEDKLPPWKGDYHNDLNTQMSYWHYLKANHLEEGESFIEFLRNLIPEAREFAHSFFDAPGICLPSVMTIEGRPLGGWPMYSLTLTSQIWLCQAFDLHWKYTGDEDFLRERVYPYFKETAKCILRWLEPDEEGKLKLPLSSSPEIHDDGIDAWLRPNSNFDLSLLIYLFKTLHFFAVILNNGDRDMWKQTFESLDYLAVNENHVLMVDRVESLKESHRHFSHAMAIYPLKLLEYGTNKREREIIDATVNELERLGTGLWVGFSFTWMAELYALQGNGEGAAYQLKLFWENFCSPNGFHLNGDYKKRGLSSWHYRPFTLEANMCAADALQEMLLKTDGYVIRVFPAIPENWKIEGAAFYNLRGWNGVLVSAEIKDGKVSYICLVSTKSGEYAVYNSFDSERIKVVQGNQHRVIECKIDEIFRLQIKEGEKYILKTFTSCSRKN